MKRWIRPYYKDSNSYKKLFPNSKLEIDFATNIKLQTKNYHEALLLNARSIADTFPQPFDVMLSGGIDSEVIVRINKDLGIKQNVYTIRLENNYNKRDVDSAIEICKSLSVPLKIIDFDVKKFFENDAESLYKKTYASRVETLPRFKWHDFFDNVIIFGDGEPYWRRAYEGDYSRKSPWNMYSLEYEFAQDFYGAHINKEVVGNWYTFIPDIYFQFIKENLIKDIIDDKAFGKLSTWSSRVRLHRTIWPDIKDKIKLVGYEADESPGTIPNFMLKFKEEIMKDVTSTELEFTQEFIESLCE